MFTIQTIFDKNLLDNAKLVAGERGIRNPIQWVNCMEILDTPESLQHGELLVTTGYHLDNEKEYADFLERAAKRSISGIAIQPGYYISRIPAYIIAEGNRLNIPIIELPAHLTFSGILHILIRNITNPNENPIEKEYKKILISLTLLKNVQNHSIGIVICSPLQHAEANSIQEFLAIIQQNIFSRLCTAVDLKTGTTIAFLMISPQAGITTDILQAEITTAISNYSFSHKQQIFCTLLNITATENIVTTFSKGYTLTKKLYNDGACKGACCNTGLVFFSLCKSLNDKKETAFILTSTIEPLFHYDLEHKKTLIRTLRLYFATHGQISTCAKILGIHRKTVKKRLERITLLCKMSPESYSAGMGLTVSLAIHDYFHI